MQAKSQGLLTHIILLFGLVGVSTALTWFFFIRTGVNSEYAADGEPFNEIRAYQDIVSQVSLGPRIPGSKAHQQVSDWIVEELIENGWEVEVQESEAGDFHIKNIIGKKGTGKPWIIIGAHYDSRIFADKDPVLENRQQAVPGANDGASGVAVLLELSRILDDPGKSGALWLVFFDAEDNGNIDNRSWIMGSQFFVDTLNSYPDRVVILDMIGDKDLGIYQEKNSDVQVTQEIWDTAIKLGYGSYFISELKYRIIDDHLPFIEKGITAVDIIDFDYPYWHTTMDTPDKVSAESLKIVGDTILTWVKNQLSH
jgi:glutaminyl-peptide cyclotransferase